MFQKKVYNFIYKKIASEMLVSFVHVFHLAPQSSFKKNNYSTDMVQFKMKKKSSENLRQYATLLDYSDSNFKGPSHTSGKT